MLPPEVVKEQELARRREEAERIRLGNEAKQREIAERERQAELIRIADEAKRLKLEEEGRPQVPPLAVKPAPAPPPTPPEELFAAEAEARKEFREPVPQAPPPPTVEFRPPTAAEIRTLERAAEQEIRESERAQSELRQLGIPTEAAEETPALIQARERLEMATTPTEFEARFRKYETEFGRVYGIGPRELERRLASAEAGGLFEAEAKETAEAQAAVDALNRAIGRVPRVITPTQKTISEQLAEPSARLAEIGEREAPLLFGVLPAPKEISEEGLSGLFAIGGAFLKTTPIPFLPPISPGEAKIIAGTAGVAGATIVGAIEAPGIELARLRRPESVARLRPALTPISAVTFPEFKKFRAGAAIATPIIFALEAKALSPVFKFISPVTKPVSQTFRAAAARSARVISRTAPAKLQERLRHFLETMRVRRGVPVGKVEIAAREFGDDVLVSVKGKFRFDPRGEPFRVPRKPPTEFQKQVTELLTPERQRGLFVTRIGQVPTLRQKILDPFARVLPKRLRVTVRGVLGPKRVEQVRFIRDEKFLELTRGVGVKFPGTKIPAVALKKVTPERTEILTRGLFPVERGKLFKILPRREAARQELARLGRGLEFPGQTPKLRFVEAPVIRRRGEEFIGLFQPRITEGLPRITIATKIPREQFARTFFHEVQHGFDEPRFRNILRAIPGPTGTPASFRRFKEALKLAKLESEFLAESAEIAAFRQKILPEVLTRFKTILPEGKEITRRTFRAVEIIGKERRVGIERALTGRVPIRIRPAGFQVTGRGVAVAQMTKEEFSELLVKLGPGLKVSKRSLTADVRGLIAPERLGETQRFVGEVRGLGFGLEDVLIPVETDFSGFIGAVGVSALVVAGAPAAPKARERLKFETRVRQIPRPDVDVGIIPIAGVRARAAVGQVQRVKVAAITRQRIAQITAPAIKTPQITQPTISFPFGVPIEEEERELVEKPFPLRRLMVVEKLRVFPVAPPTELLRAPKITLDKFNGKRRRSVLDVSIPEIKLPFSDG